VVEPNWIRKRFDSIRSVWSGTPGLAGVSKALVAITLEVVVFASRYWDGGKPSLAKPVTKCRMIKYVEE
jgi:hypothetical protein